MRIVRSEKGQLSAGPAPSRKRRVPGITVEARLLLFVSVLAIAMTAETARRRLAEAEQFAPVVNLNAADPAALAVLGDVFPSQAERTFAATRIVQWVRDRGGIDRVSAISSIPIPAGDIRANAGLARLNDRLQRTPGDQDVMLLSGADVAGVRPALSVRSAAEFWRKVLLALLLT